jgi:dihydroflavonol-4-reductase
LAAQAALRAEALAVMKALVTGSNGLIGANLARALVKAGHNVRALVRRSSNDSTLQGVGCEIAVGDVMDSDSLERASDGCDWVFHAAAIFGYHGYDRAELERVAVGGTRCVLNAARRVGVRRVVLTSSSVVCGSSRTTRPRTEMDEIDDEDASAYDQAKAAQERVAFELGRTLSIDVVAVCPAMSVGPHDTRLTPSNALIVRYLEDPFHLTYPGGCNVVSVRDVANAHVLAAERGEPGQRYLVGADNLEWSLLYRHVSELCGISGPSLPIGHTAAYLLASAHEFWAASQGIQPRATRTQARMLGRFYWYDSGRIRKLGLSPRPTRLALAEAISWLVASPLVSNDLRRSLVLSPEVWETRRAAPRGNTDGPL